MIAFVGSVFSPYYAWAGRREPENHVSINICLYGPRGAWAMTERGRADLERDKTHIRVGPSSMRWENGALTVEFDERAVPFPRRLRGRLRIVPEAVNERTFTIAQGHEWRPVAPQARIEMDAPAIGLQWRGHGYHDTNQGVEGLEHGFRRWNWSRAQPTHGGSDWSAILYDVEPREEPAHTIALRFGRDGVPQEFEPPRRASLRRGLWGVRRDIQCDDGVKPRLVRSLEDAPFYTRAEVRSRLLGEDVVSVHECLDGNRFGSAWVKALLPFRMPRRAKG